MSDELPTYTNHYRCQCGAEWSEHRRAIIDAQCARCDLVVPPHRYVEHRPGHSTIESIDRDTRKRNAAALDQTPQDFATSSGTQVDIEPCASGHNIAARRFSDCTTRLHGGES